VLSDREREVLDRIEDREDDIVALLQRLIRFQTVTPSNEGVGDSDEYRELQQFVQQTLQEMDFDTEMWEVDAAELERFPGGGVNPNRDLSGMPVVVGQRKGAGGGRSLILNGHYDVVPPGMVENWHHDPFGGEVVEGRVYGRGTCDMKGGIAAMLWAVRCLQEAGIELAGDLTIETVPDEESSCMGTLSCCQRGYTADAAIIPETTDMKVLVAMRGSLYGKIRVVGRAGHAELSQPHWSEGGAVSAISKAMKVVAALEDLTEQWRTRPDKQHELLDPDIVIPTVIHGGEWSVTYPEEVEVSFGAIFIPSTTNMHEEIETQLRRVAELDPWLRNHPPALETREWHYGAEISGDEPIVQAGLQALEDIGLEPGLKGFGSLTDAIHLINYSHVPTISIGPSMAPAHMADEFIDIEELVQTTKAIALMMMRWCG